MASSSSTAHVQKSFKYDVFLSFRGDDTRKTFVDHLYHALDDKGIITYKDDEKIEKGERIDEQLMKSIEESRFHIIVFSKNYASSSWCLDELVKIMECQKMTEHTAYPIFYDVEPTEVRNQSGLVGEAFAKHEKEEFTRKRKRKRARTLEDAHLENEDDVERWRNAMKEAAGLAGMELKNTFNGHEAKFIQNIVVDISLKLSFINWRVDEDLVGMETRVENLVSSLEIGSEDVRMIGIWGMGGVGKTTLATAVYDRISDWFEGTSFVENVREVSESSLSGLKELQRKVLSDVLNDQSIIVKSASDGKNKMIKVMGSRKVLVVLDDVDNVGQLEALAGKPNWFKPGSRIIITTRDEQVLIAHGVQSGDIHDVNLLTHEEAICLFSRYAFKRETPKKWYEELSEKVVHYAAGLPLTIKVLGSFLCGRTELEWIDAIERLKTLPLKETLQRLELSYNGLENDHKEIFLDVVCMLKGREKDEAIRVLESCGFKAQIGLRVLEQKSLITITYDDGLTCHDHIEEMGMNIVRRLHPDQPNRHSRLWITEEIEDILVNDLGTEATRCIKMEGGDLHPATIMKGLRKMGKLRYLRVLNRYRDWKVDEETASDDYDDDNDDDDDDYDDDDKYLLDGLRYLYWFAYPFCWLPKRFLANELVKLEMNYSNIFELWKGGETKILTKLRFLNIKYSKLRTFDLGLTPHLEELNLEGCKDFEEIRFPFECFNLKSINLSKTKVSFLNLGMTPHLERLNLLSCYYLQEINAPVRCLRNLYFLDLSCLRFQQFLVDNTFKSGAALRLTVESLDKCPLHPNSNLPNFQFTCEYDETLPSWSGNLEKLISFGLCTCTNLESLSASICGLQHLKQLTLKGSITLTGSNPEGPFKLQSLESLTLETEEIKHLPDHIYMLKNLKSLELRSCKRLEQISENICRLECLKSLVLSFCILVEKLPEELGRLEGLEMLDIKGCSLLRYFPNSMCNMKCLKLLNLSYCSLVEKLPKELGRLECLEKLDLTGCKSLRDIPNSISNMKFLKRLHLSDCILIENLAEELGGLDCLEDLHITKCKSLRNIPNSICNMKCLKRLDLSDCILIEMLPEELGRLECLQGLYITGCNSLRHIPNSICNMKCLERLHLSGCIEIEKLPEELGRLEHLKYLNIHGAGISGLPQSIYQLKGLRISGSRKQLESYGFSYSTNLFGDRYYVEL